MEAILAFRNYTTIHRLSISCLTRWDILFSLSIFITVFQFSQFWSRCTWAYSDAIASLFDTWCICCYLLQAICIFFIDTWFYHMQSLTRALQILELLERSQFILILSTMNFTSLCRYSLFSSVNYGKYCLMT